MREEDHLVSLERELHRADQRKSDRVRTLLADDFLEYGSSGRIYDKSVTVSMLQAEDPVDYDSRGYHVDMIAPNVARVRYATCYPSTPPKYSLRMSLWRKVGDQWQMFSHQGTLTTQEIYLSM